MPKPVLSDSLFNADDVATAVLSEANLQVANSNLGITDHGSSFYTVASGWDDYGESRFFSFNGIMFFNFRMKHVNATPANKEICLTINNSNYHPTEANQFPTVSYEGDSGSFIALNTSGEFSIESPSNVGISNYYICTSGSFRFT